MPVITIDAPPLSKEQKAELVKSIAQNASKIMNLPMSAMVVIIHEIQAENVGVGDILLCDRD